MQKITLRHVGQSMAEGSFDFACAKLLTVAEIYAIFYSKETESEGVE